MTLVKTIRFTGLFILCLNGSNALAQNTEDEEPIDLFALVLAEADLVEATRATTIYDTDEDGYIDREEQESLKWRESASDYDLNKDGKLTHLELAVRHAKLRDDSGVTQFDINNAKKFMRRHDKNRNGQLEVADETADWPPDPSEFDKNSNGIITLTEMSLQFAFNRELRREMGIEAVDQTGAARIVNQFDTDKDKRLDESERHGAPLPYPAADFDDDGDGKVGIMEIATMLSKHRRAVGLTKADQMKARKLMGMMDANGDNMITASELANRQYANSIMEQYKPLDSNQDGVITMTEIENHLAAIRKERGYGPEAFQKAKQLMTRHDTNRSKFIEDFELEESASEGKLPRSLIKKVDLDKDNRISFDELAKHLAKES